MMTPILVCFASGMFQGQKGSSDARIGFVRLGFLSKGFDEHPGSPPGTHIYA